VLLLGQSRTTAALNWREQTFRKSPVQKPIKDSRSDQNPLEEKKRKPNFFE